MTSSLEPVDHVAQSHQAQSNFKGLGDDGQGDTFQETFHMKILWVKVVFVSKIVFFNLYFDSTRPPPFVESTVLIIVRNLRTNPYLV